MRPPVALPAAFAAFLAVSGTASSRTAMDPTFQGTGVITRSFGDFSILPADMTVLNDGKIIIAGAARYSSGYTDTAVYGLLSDGSPDPAFSDSSGRYVSTWSPQFDQANVLLPQSGGGFLIAGSDDTVPNGRSSHFLQLHANGTLDTSWGPGAVPGHSILLHPGYGTGGIASLTPYPGGKFIATGVSRGLFRLLPDATLDNSFGTAGFATAVDVNNSALVTAVQPDGKILAGKAEALGFTIARLLPDGTLDPSFAGGVNNALIWRNGDGATLRRLIPLGDGRILAVGQSFAGNSRPVFTIARILPDGTLDTSFNSTGVSDIELHTGASHLVSTALLQPDGRILIVGTLGIGSSDEWEIALARFLPDGAPDPSFGINGKLNSGLLTQSPHCAAAFIPGPAGKLLVASHRTTPFGGPLPQFILARFDTRDNPQLGVVDQTGNFLGSPSSAPQDFGIIAIGSRTREFALRNIGELPLTGLAVSLTDETHPGEYQFSQPAVTTLAPGAEIKILVTLSVPSAGAPGPRSAALRIASNDPFAPLFTLSLTGRKASPLEIWRLTWFGSPENSGIGSDLNDFDRDGLRNFAEFVLGTNPHVVTPWYSSLTLTDDALELTWTRAKVSLTTHTARVESSATPAGPWNTAGITETIVSEDDTLRTIKTRIPRTPGTPAGFVRLRVF